MKLFQYGFWVLANNNWVKGRDAPIDYGQMKSLFKNGKLYRVIGPGERGWTSLCGRYKIDFILSSDYFTIIVRNYDLAPFYAVYSKDRGTISTLEGKSEIKRFLSTIPAGAFEL